MTPLPKVKTTSGGDLYYHTHHEMSFKSVLSFVSKTFFSKVIPPESLKRGFYKAQKQKYQ
jgi:hypothetical protein